MDADVRQAPAWPGDRGGHVWAKDREVVAADGARIRYTVRGPDDPTAPTIVLCAGFLCPDNFWEHLGAALMERHRVVVLNYRGVGASTDPRPGGYRARRLRSHDFTIERFADDVAAVCDAEGLTAVVALGHSMGCQVALALQHRRPELVAGLVLLTGPYASPLHTFYGTKLGVYLFPLAYLGVPLLPRPFAKRIGRILRTPLAMPGARVLRALGPVTPGEGMAGYFQHFGEVDPAVVLKIARGMHRFDASPWLGQVKVPTQVLVGGRDTFAPPEIGEELLARLPDAELVTLPEATHGAPIEFPDEIHDQIADFLHRRLGGPEVERRGRAGVTDGPVIDRLASAS